MTVVATLCADIKVEIMCEYATKTNTMGKKSPQRACAVSSTRRVGVKVAGVYVYVAVAVAVAVDVGVTCHIHVGLC